ncbi:hypothetical protein D3C72_1722570 [compost metagenome]
MTHHALYDLGLALVVGLALDGSAALEGDAVFLLWQAQSTRVLDQHEVLFDQILFLGKACLGKYRIQRVEAHRSDLRMQRRMLLPGAGSAMLDAALAPLRVAAPADDHDLLLGGDV